MGSQVELLVERLRDGGIFPFGNCWYRATGLDTAWHHPLIFSKNILLFSRAILRWCDTS